MAASSKTALVTGANKGIGLAIVRGLAKAGFDVVLTARSSENGLAAQKVLQEEGLSVDYYQMDVTDPASVERAALYMKTAKGGCDVLVNNAGIAWKGDAFDSTVAGGTAATNYFGVKTCLEIFCRGGIMRSNGRTVTVSSRAGDFRKLSPELHQKMTDPSLTGPQLTALVEEFITAVGDGTWQEKGWPKTAYGVSKMAATSLVRIFARDEQHGIAHYSMCPGWVKTDMAGPKAPKTPDQGADTALFLATAELSSLKSGQFYAERAEMDVSDMKWVA